nr:MAG TPA: hypothetical protein [Caudoviricetes sp.]
MALLRFLPSQPQQRVCCLFYVAMFITGEVFRGFWHPFNQPRWARRRGKLNE